MPSRSQAARKWILLTVLFAAAAPLAAEPLYLESPITLRKKMPLWTDWDLAANIDHRFGWAGSRTDRFVLLKSEEDFGFRSGTRLLVRIIQDGPAPDAQLGSFRLWGLQAARSSYASGPCEAARAPRLRRLLKPSRVDFNEDGLTATVRRDGRIFISGAKVAVTYSVTLDIPPGRFTGIALEAVPDRSLAYGGPGRGKMGNYLVSRVEAEVAPLHPDQEPAPIRSGPVSIRMRRRVFDVSSDAFGPGRYRSFYTTERVQPAQLAVVIVDELDDAGLCVTDRRIRAALLERMNAFLAWCRKRNITIIHAPAAVISTYDTWPQRRAFEAFRDPSIHVPPTSLDLWRMPKIYSGMACLCSPSQPCLKNGPLPKPPPRIHPALTIAPHDFIGNPDDPAEMIGFLRKHGITHVLFAGEALDLCLQGRGIRPLTNNGFKGVLLRDLTISDRSVGRTPLGAPDPTVTPERCTAQTVNFAERYVLPTVSSTELMAESSTPAP